MGMVLKLWGTERPPLADEVFPPGASADVKYFFLGPGAVERRADKMPPGAHDEHLENSLQVQRHHSDKSEVGAKA